MKFKSLTAKFAALVLTFGLAGGAWGAAQIGDTPYATLAEAVAAVGTATTITMTADEDSSSNVTIPEGVSITLDGGANPGHQVGSIVNNGTLTLKGYINAAEIVNNGQLSFSYAYSAATTVYISATSLENKGTLTLTYSYTTIEVADNISNYGTMTYAGSVGTGIVGNIINYQTLSITGDNSKNQGIIDGSITNYGTLTVARNASSYSNTQITGKVYNHAQMTFMVGTRVPTFAEGIELIGDNAVVTGGGYNAYASKLDAVTSQITTSEDGGVKLQVYDLGSNGKEYNWSTSELPAYSVYTTYGKFDSFKEAWDVVMAQTGTPNFTLIDDASVSDILVDTYTRSGDIHLYLNGHTLTVTETGGFSFTHNPWITDTGTIVVDGNNFSERFTLVGSDRQFRLGKNKTNFVLSSNPSLSVTAALGQVYATSYGYEIDDNYDTSYIYVRRSGSVVHVDSIALDKTEMTLAVGETNTLTATIAPANATDKFIVWSAGDINVASIETPALPADIATIKVIGQSAGTAYVFARPIDWGTANPQDYVCCTVTVTRSSNFFKDANDDNLWHIANLAGLQEFRDEVNAGNSFAGKTVVLDVDIDMSSIASWDPIGQDYETIQGGDKLERRFAGTFDGNNKTLSNLTINDNTHNEAGLFGVTGYGSTFKDLTLDSPTVNGRIGVGTLAGKLWASSVVNCHVTGDITVTGYQCVGGLAGSDSYTDITGCSVIGDDKATSVITGNYVAGIEDGDNIGGLVGMNGPSDPAAQKADQATSNCSVGNLTLRGWRKVGGLSGQSYNRESVYDCSVGDIDIICLADTTFAAAKEETLAFGGMVGIFAVVSDDTKYRHAENSYLEGTVSNVTITCANDDVNALAKMGIISGGQRGSTSFVVPTDTQFNVTVSGTNSTSGTKVSDNKDKIYSAHTTPVAQIGDATYGSLADAIAAVPTTGAEATITMIADSVEATDTTITVPATKNVVLNLNGFTVSSHGTAKDSRFIINRGSLTIQDSSSGASGVVTFYTTTPDGSYSKENITIYNIDGTLNLLSGKIENTSHGGATYAVCNSSNAWGKNDDKETVFNMTGGVISAPEGDAALRVYQNCAQNSDPFSHNTVTISGGTILDTGIFVDNNIYQATAQTTGEGILIDIDITGGTINGLIDLKLRHAFNTSLNISGGDFTNAKLRVRKQTDSSHVWGVQSEPAEPLVTISGGTWSFVNSANTAFNVSSGWTTTSSWTSYKPYHVTGGVFNVDLNNYAGIVFEEGKTGVANTDESTMAAYPYTVGVAVVPVAQIGETTYGSLADAIAAVPTDGTETTITMLDNSVEATDTTITIAATKNIVLDLAGYTVSSHGTAKDSRFIDNKGVLTVKDTSEGETGKITFYTTTPDGSYSKENITIYNIGGTLTLLSGKIENTSNGGATYAVNNSSNAWGQNDDKDTVFVMEGGVISAPSGDAALRVYQNCAQSATPYSHNRVTLNGGTILDTGIFLDNYIYQPTTSTTGEGISTAVVINEGATVNGLIDLKLRHAFNTSLTINGGTFGNSKLRVRKHTEWNSNVAEPTEPMVTINGGRFQFAESNRQAFYIGYDSTTHKFSTYAKPYKVTGGLFNVDLNGYETIVFEEGKTGVANTDESTMAAYPYTVGVPAYVAQIGDAKFTTLAAAFEAATSGATITLLADCETGAEFTIGNPLKLTAENVTLDLNGKTVTANNNFSFGVCARGVTVRNGSIVSAENNAKTTKINSYILVVGAVGVNDAISGVTLDGVTMVGGLSVGGSSDAVIKGQATSTTITDCDITSGDYYAVCSQNHSDVTIESGTYTANKANNCTTSRVLQGCFIGNDGPEGSIVVTGGKFIGAINTTNVGLVVLKDGYYSVVPNAGLVHSTKLCTTKPYSGDVYRVVDKATVTFAAGDGAPADAEVPESFVYPSGDRAEIKLGLPTYTSTDYTFGGWKIGGEGNAISSLPAGTKGDVELVGTWTKVQKITVQVPDTTSQEPEQTKSVELKVTEEWIEQTLNKTAVQATTTEIQTALNAEQDNGLTGFENYVLGLDGTDPNAKVKVDSAQSDSETSMPVVNTVKQTVDTGFEVKYSLDKVNAQGTVTQEGTKQDTSDLDLNLVEATQNSNSAYFKMTATIVEAGTDNKVKSVASENTIGVMKVESQSKTTVIGVPWTSLSDDDSISVSDIVRTSTLSEGDQIQVYDTDAKGYRSWTLDKNGVWQPETVVGGASSEEANNVKIDRGKGVLLTRKGDTSKPIYLVGEAPTNTVSTTLEKATDSNTPAWNLVASPSVEAKTIEQVVASTKDTIIVPTDSAPRNYTYKDGEWGYSGLSTETITNKLGIIIVRPVRVTGDTQIPAGRGFWYLNKDTSDNEKKINW